MINTGISIQQVESLLLQNRVNSFCTVRERFVALNRGSDIDFPGINDPCVSFWKQHPSRHSVAACYLLQFWERDVLYTCHMKSLTLPAGKLWLSCDHTFHSVANIGMVRSADNRWIKQYKGLFCVLNGLGEVMTWKLTKRLTFDEIENSMQALHDRLCVQGTVVESFYIDNCCSWKNKLTAVFGPQLNVYLDLFHAVQRISCKISKKHPLYHQCILSLRLVFRNPADQGIERKMDTPPPDLMEQNILKFKEQWTKGGMDVLNSAALKEIGCLLVHIRKGCLSGIPPGHGTSRNERLHRDLNHCLSQGKYGVELAYGLITSIFFNHNEKTVSRLEKRDSKPINSYAHDDSGINGERFGLSWKDVETVRSRSVQHDRIEMVKVGYEVVRDQLACCNLFIEEDGGEQDFDLSQENSVNILHQAVRAFYIARELQKLTKTATVNSRDIYFFSFMAAVHNLLGKQTEAQESGDSDEKRLLDVLSSWNLQKVQVAGDGNCLFTAVACNLLHLISNGDVGILHTLSSLGADTENLTLSYLRQFLRKIMVDEWISNTCYYQSFVTVDLLLYAESYLTSGEFGGDVGDLMVLTLANVLNYPITIFTSIPDMPLLCITPQNGGPGASCLPLFLTFNQNGPGHYDYAVHIDSLLKCPREKVLKCTCGRKRGYKGKACSTPRCKCVTSSTGCTSLCSCKCCTNSHGIRPPCSGKRNRVNYDNSIAQPLAGSSVASFMAATGEEVTTGYFTLFEDVLLKCLLVWCIANSIEISIQKIHYMYLKVFSISKSCTTINFPLFERSIRDVEKFFKKVCKAMNLLELLLACHSTVSL
jgi:hypothetical protein